MAEAPRFPLGAKTAALMTAVVVLALVSVLALWSSISALQTALPLDHLMKERDFSALQQDMGRLDRDLRLFVAEPSQERRDALLASLDYVVLRARDNLRVHGEGDAVVRAFHEQLSGAVFGLELLLAPSAQEVVVGHYNRMVVPLRDTLPLWRSLRAQAQALNDEVFQNSMERVSAQIKGLEKLRQGLLAGLVLVAGATASMIYLLLRQQRSYLRLKSLQQEVHQLAFQDPLTGLANRRLLMDRLEHAIALADRQGRFGALMYLDLDRFKALNDSLGHDVGDRLLKLTAQRLRHSTRAEDTVARMGGDEFVVILENLGEDERSAALAAELVAEKVRATLGQPALLGERHPIEWQKSASVGVTVFGRPRLLADQVLKQADLALYQAKDAGRDMVRFFSPEMQQAVGRQASIEHGLRDAMRLQQFEVLYQPIVSPDGQLQGAEALLRWRQGDGGLVSPAAFIDVAEESGLIVPLGQWVLKTAVDDWQRWHRARPDLSLRLAVNVSARQVRHPDFVTSVTEAVPEGAMPPGLLTLELTESALLSSLEDTRHKMLALQAHGLTFSLDDFGTGYGSLTYLRRLPFSVVKIDRSFVENIGNDEGDEAICAAIVALARKLRLQVVAEGVERQSQLSFCATSHPCDGVQGYFFSPAVSADRFAEWVLGGGKLSGSAPATASAEPAAAV